MIVQIENEEEDFKIPELRQILEGPDPERLSLWSKHDIENPSALPELKP